MNHTSVPVYLYIYWTILQNIADFCPNRQPSLIVNISFGHIGHIEYRYNFQGESQFFRSPDTRVAEQYYRRQSHGDADVVVIEEWLAAVRWPILLKPPDLLSTMQRHLSSAISQKSWLIWHHPPLQWYMYLPKIAGSSSKRTPTRNCNRTWLNVAQEKEVCRFGTFLVKWMRYYLVFRTKQKPYGGLLSIQKGINPV